MIGELESRSPQEPEVPPEGGQTASDGPGGPDDVENQGLIEPEADDLVEEAEVVEGDLDADEAESELLAIAAASFSGPLPHPDFLRQYQEVVHEGAERIVKEWEKETEHRRSLQAKQVDAATSGLRRGQRMTFIVILAIGVGGLILVGLGYNLVGLAAFLAALATVATTFFPGIRFGKGSNPDSDDGDS